jgi:hypothetical protein
MRSNDDLAFPYTSLEVTPPMIRLVRLYRTPEGLVTGDLEPFSLDPPNCVPFRTLSYVWGKPGCAHEIILNGRPFLVFESLYPVLELICDSSNLAACWWWIDSICINQRTDKDAMNERGAQVALMGRIYKQSERTLGWLGKASEGDISGQTGADAMAFLRVLLENRWALDSTEQRSVVKKLSDRTKWRAVERLLLLPWWRRVWTLQEYIIAREFDFYCGKENMSREDFKVASYSIYLCRHIDETLLTLQAWQPMWNRRRLYMWYRNKSEMQLLSLVAYGSDSQATNPRDRIYALLGLAKDHGLGSPPDYQCDVGKVYATLVKSFVETHKSLDIICFTHLFYSKARAADLGPALPSWVPDWQVQTEAFVVPVMASQSARSHIGNFRPVDRIALPGDAAFYAAAGDTCPDIRFSHDLTLLSCKGIFVDSVDGVGGLTVDHRDWTGSAGIPGPYVDIYQLINSSSPHNSARLPKTNVHPGKASKILDDISRCLVLDRRDRYLSYPTPPSYFYPDFKAFCLAAIQRPTEVAPEFLHWFELNKSIFIRGHSLEELCLAADSTSLSATTKDVDMSDTNVFLSRMRDTTESMGRRLITTNAGYIGMGPCRVKKGDKICVLLGCSIPLILRHRPGTTSSEVIGECYLHGFMNGEVLVDLDTESSKIKEFELS